MRKLNLPAFNHQIKKAEGKVWIFDGIRKKYVVLTPEEWVRQHLIHYLVGHLKYPRTLIKVESGLQFNQLAKRSDIVVFDRAGRSWMVLECKSPDQEINPETAKQVSVYNATLKAKYVAITNGLHHFCFQVDHAGRNVTLLNDFPVYS